MERIKNALLLRDGASTSDVALTYGVLGLALGALLLGR